VGKGAGGNIERLVAEKGFFKSCGEGEGPALAACVPRKVLTPPPTAYLKIQEGCNNRCSYCTIPSIKGPLQSRPPLLVEEEFRELLAGGYREFNVIGQDITSYGRDAGTDIGKLLSRLLSVKGDYFIRLLYMHPKGIDDGLLDLMRSDDRILPYLDIPIQHAEDRLLTSMNRGYSRKALDRLFGKIKSDMPDAVLRTTVMVGYPGETEDAFMSLCAFISAWEFDNLGAFIYSREAGTASARVKGHVPKSIKKRRYQKVMELQREISGRRLMRLKGREMPVVVEAREADAMTGRLLLQAPDVDGIAFIKGDCAPGEIRTGKVTGTTDYDVIVEVGAALL
jgi:ribosomal protein S12 methylthiotransferase